MLLRVFGYRLVNGTGPSFERSLVAELIPQFRALEGVSGSWFGRSREADRYVIVSCWDEVDSISRAVGLDVTRPVFRPEFAGMLSDVDLAHYEGLDLPTLATGDAALARILTGRLEANSESTFFDAVRSNEWPALGRSPGLAGAFVGRRENGGAVEFASVTLWRSWADLVAAAGGSAERPVVSADNARYLLNAQVEHFDLFDATTGATEASGDH